MFMPQEEGLTGGFMDAKECRESYKDYVYPINDREKTLWANGYLAALDGEEVGCLLSFIEYFLNQERMTFMECSQAEDLWSRAKEALAKFRATAGGNDANS